MTGAAIVREPAMFSISAVAEATGLTTHTIRVWQRRYGAVEPARTPGGSRIYSHADVARLRRLRELSQAGHAIRHIARLSDAELERLLSPERTAPDTTDGGVVERFLALLDRFDVTGAGDLLAQAAALLGPHAFVRRVAAPLLEAIGLRWASGELHVYQEHAASGVLRSVLAVLLRGQSPRTAMPTVLVGTLGGERHELGALMVALTVAAEGWRVIHLDSHARGAEVQAAAVSAGASVVLISMVDEWNPVAQAELDVLAVALAPHVLLGVGGRSAGKYHAHCPRARLLSLEQLGGELARRGRRRGPSLTAEDE